MDSFNDFDYNGYGYYDNGYNAVGVYTPKNQFDFDVNKLRALGFTLEEINFLGFIVANGGSVSRSELCKNGLTYEQASRIKYMYDIVIGKTSVESTDDLSKHLRKMFGNYRHIGIQDLAVSRISEVPRKAVIAGITDKTFSVYNSAGKPQNERMYNVVGVTKERIYIETPIKPVLKYKQQKFVDGVIEIKELKGNGNVVVAVDKKYIRLVNRFVIIASLRRPEFHLGMVEIICIEGTKVYVYAQTMGVRDTVKYNMGTQRVYDYGFFNYEIKPKLLAVATELYKLVCGVYAEKVPANQDFIMISPDKTDAEDDNSDDIEIEY